MNRTTPSTRTTFPQHGSTIDAMSRSGPTTVGIHPAHLDGLTSRRSTVKPQDGHALYTEPVTPEQTSVVRSTCAQRYFFTGLRAAHDAGYRAMEAHILA